jgi:hypothetical protein
MSYAGQPHKFVILHEGDAGNVLERVANLKDAAHAAQLHCIVLDSTAADYTDLPSLDRGDMLYNAGRGSARLETLLVRPHVATFYKQNPPMVFDRYDSTVFTALHDKLGIPGPKTIHRLPNAEPVLDRYVDFLGGFPIVLKAVGGTGGIGTILVESMRSLKSLVEYCRQQRVEFILREFIEPAEVARLTVLGQQVVASNRKFVRASDFRTTSRNPPVQAKKYSQEIEELALAATHCCELEFGGVDVLIRPDATAVVLEMNFPCDYITSELATGIPIGSLMVDYLRRKAQYNLGRNT